MATEDTSIRVASGDQAAGADSLAGLEATRVTTSGASIRPHGSSASLLTAGAAPEDKTVISKRAPLSASLAHAVGPQHALGAALVGQRLEHYELNEFVG